MRPRTIDRKPSAPDAASHPPDEEFAEENWIKRWDRFWFTPADPIGLCLVRIIGGLLVLYVHLCYTPDLLSYVGGDQAWLDNKVSHVLRKVTPIYSQAEDWIKAPTVHAWGNYTWSIFYHVTDPFWICTIHYTFLGIMFLFLIGLWTRITTVLTWLACLCYIQRAPTLQFGMDTMMVIFLFYMMIGPCGAMLSVDRWLEVRRARKRYGPGYVPPVEPSLTANFALRGMQIHYCLIYLGAGTSKLMGGRWWNGTALWYCYANYAFAPMAVGVYYDLLVFLCHHRWLWEIVMMGGVIFTLFLELGFPFLVWSKRTRWLMVCGAVLLHTGIGVFMGLVTFSMFMLCLLLAFVPPDTIQLFLREFGRPVKRLLQGKGEKRESPGQPTLAVSRT